MAGKVRLAVHDDGENVLLAWVLDGPSEGVVGFAIERKLTRAGVAEQGWLLNRVGFEDEVPVPGSTRPSTAWPFQRLTWTDYEVMAGDTVQYRVVPVLLGDGELALEEARASRFSRPLTLGPEAGEGISVYFNRGFVISQFMARALQGDFSAARLRQFKASLGDSESALRRFLGGALRDRLLALLAEAARDDGIELFAALFELTDPELLAALAAVGERAHVVLGNGAVERRGEDENAEARARLREAGVDVLDRMSAPRALAHNKFVVLSRGRNQPYAVWTGSANWMPTGLCTQINNGILIERGDLAKHFLAQWHALAEAGNATPAALKEANSRSRRGRRGSGDLVWFTPTRQMVDIQALRELVQGARRSLHFLMFMPGDKGILPDVLALAGQPGFDLRGVINTFPEGSREEVEARVVGNGAVRPLQLQVVEPAGAGHGLGWWIEEVGRRQFRAIGHSIVHSKLLVIDAFEDAPVVVTGSHNFSKSASDKNDENFVVLRGPVALARKYAVHVKAVHDHYRWRAYLLQSRSPWRGLERDAGWYARYANAARRAEAETWLDAR